MTAIILAASLILATGVALRSYVGMCRTYGVSRLRPLSQGRRPK